MRMFSALMILFLGVGGAQAQDHVLNAGPFAMMQIEEAIAAAHSTTAPGYEASAPYPREQGDGGKMITVTHNGLPILVYRPELYGHDGWQPDLTFSCGPDQTVDITQMLFGYGEGQVPPDGATLALRIMPYGQDDFTMPVTLIETLDDPRVLIRVHGRVSAHDPFFRNLGATTNFQVQLMVNGRYERLSGGGDFSTFDRDVKPLLNLCAGGNIGGTGGGAPGSSDPRPEIASVWAPDASEIKTAIEARLAQQMAIYDGMADQCNTFKRDDNPLGAVACMMSGFGMSNSDNMQVTVHGVDLDECVRAQSGEAYCRYRVNAEMRGQGIMGQVADIANLGLGLGGWSYGSFDRAGGSWSLLRTYDNCHWGNGEINCTYRN